MQKSCSPIYFSGFTRYICMLYIVSILIIIACERYLIKRSCNSLIFKDRKVLLWFTLALTNLHTYLRTYILTNILTNKSLLKKSSYTKTSLTKKLPNDTSTCSKFFFRGRNPKNDRDRAKKPSFLTKNCGLSVFS